MSHFRPRYSRDTTISGTGNLSWTATTVAPGGYRVQYGIRFSAAHTPSHQLTAPGNPSAPSFTRHSYRLPLRYPGFPYTISVSALDNEGEVISGTQDSTTWYQAFTAGGSVSGDPDRCKNAQESRVTAFWANTHYSTAAPAS